jgi:hypothetical protein
LPNFATLLCLKYIFAKEITTIRKKKMEMEKKGKFYILIVKLQISTPKGLQTNILHVYGLELIL